VVAAALVMGACGGDDDSDTGDDLGRSAAPGVAGPRYPYDQVAIENFVRECAKTGSRSACVCTIERLQQTLPFEEFKAADEAIREDRVVSARTRATIDAAAEACRE
jgi:hypothetical protein